MDDQPSISNCKSCGNKIRMSVSEWHDHGATIKCPQIKCDYCDITAGNFYPGEEGRCIAAWNDKQEGKS